MRVLRLLPLVLAATVPALLAADPRRLPQDDAVSTGAESDLGVAAQAALDAGDAETAAELAERWTEAAPDAPRAHLVLGLAREAAGFSGADEALDRALDLAGDDGPTLLAVADVYGVRYSTYLADDPGYAPAALARAQELYGRLARVPEHEALALGRLAWLEQAGGNVDATRTLLAAAIGRHPRDESLHGQLWKLLGRGLTYDELAALYAGLARSADPEDLRARHVFYGAQVRGAQGESRMLAARAAAQADDPDRAEVARQSRAARDAWMAAFHGVEAAAADSAELAPEARILAAGYRAHRLESFAADLDLAAARLEREEVERALVPLLPSLRADSRVPDLADRAAVALVEAHGAPPGGRTSDASVALFPRALGNAEEQAKTLASAADDVAAFFARLATAAREAGAEDAATGLEAMSAVARAEILARGNREERLDDTIAAAEAARAALDAPLAQSPHDPLLRGLVDRLSYAIFVASGGEGGAPRGMDALRELWRFAVERVPDHAEWWNNFAFFARESRAYEDSYAAYRKAIELEPENVRFLNDAGLILFYHLDRDLDEARALFERAAELGEVEHAAGPADPARETWLRSALGDAYLNLGRLAAKQEDAAAAAAWYAKLEALDPGRIDLLSSRIELLLSQGDDAGLERVIEGALARGEDLGANEPNVANRYRALLFALELVRRERPEDAKVGEWIARIRERASAQGALRAEDAGDAP